MKNYSVTINWINIRLKDKVTTEVIHLASNEDHAFEIALATLKARNKEFLKWVECSIVEVDYSNHSNLGNAVLNQIEADMGVADFTAWGVLIEALCTNPDNVALLTAYLSDSAQKNLKDGSTSKRY
jgi:hypothetical protein